MPTGDRGRVVIVAVLAALTLYLLAFVLLSFGGAKRNGVIVVGAAVFMLLAGAFLQLALHKARAERRVDRRLLLWVPAGITIIGLGLALFAVLGPPTGGVGFCGLCLAYLGGGHALAELRSRTGAAPERGLAVMGLCAVVFVIGLALCLFVWAPLLVVAAAGLLAGPIGLTLYSEDTLRVPPAWLRRGVVVGPLLALAGAALLVTWAGVQLELTVALLGVLLVLVGAIASNTQADILLVVAVLALVWAATPGPAEPDRTIAAEPRQPTLVALGDSYMSGEGADRFYEGTNTSGVNECRRSPTAYAHIVVTERPASGLRRLQSYACSGAKARHLDERAQYPGEPRDGTPEQGADQLDQLRSLLEQPGVNVRLVIVSIGGNDAAFATIAAACLAPGSCVERGQTWLSKLEEVERNVHAAYRQIRDAVRTRAPVLAVPYPVPISPKHCDYSLLGRDEHRFLLGYVQQLNRVVDKAARDAGVHYLEAMPEAFSKERELRICDAPRERIGVNFIALRSVEGVVDQAASPVNWIHNSLHPNEIGHGVMADVLTDWVREHPDVGAMPDPNTAPSRFTPASLQQVMNTNDVSYCGGRSEPHYCDRGDGAWAITQIGLLLAAATLPALMIVLGVWLMWLPILARTRPQWTEFGNQIAKRLPGSPDSD